MLDCVAGRQLAQHVVQQLHQTLHMVANEGTTVHTTCKLSDVAARLEEHHTQARK
jgi:hypothetical protein